MAQPGPPRASPYAGIFLAVVSVSWASIFITWSTSPPITIALYRLALATLILGAVASVRMAAGKAKPEAPAGRPKKGERG